MSQNKPTTQSVNRHDGTALQSAQLLTTGQVSALTGMTKRFFEVDRLTGKSGLRFVRIGGKSVRYRLSDVTAWIESNLRKSTSDPGNQE